MQHEPSDNLPAEGSDPADSADQQVAVSSTREPRVDAALSRLDELADLTVHEHPAVFERVHAELSEVLGELDTEDHQPEPS
jgi:hypothetical protein